MFKREGLM
jgi:hypothetical protein